MWPEASPEQLLANAFAAFTEVWARERDADSGTCAWLGLLARRLSLAVSAGHVCLPLADVAEPDWPPVDALREVLLASGLVGTVDRPANLPMVLDEDDRLYLHRYFAYERALARRLLALRRGVPVDADAIRARLDAVLGKADPATADWQRLAAALAMRQQLAVISGGPGTGKTTTVAMILACLLAQSPDARIRLAAPTGKAAMRMLEAIRAQTAHLSPALQARMPVEAFTLHRLLGMTSRPGVFRHDAGNPLVLDALVVDEASMIDLALAARLLEAMPAHARLIVLGDKDQLSAVEAGAVFSELSADPALSPSCVRDLAAMTGIAETAIVPPFQPVKTGFIDSAVWLTRNFRFAADSGISRLALAIKEGNIADAKAALAQTADDSVTWFLSAASTALQPEVMACLQAGFAGFGEAIRTQSENRQAVFEAFERFRVLCAVREGSEGVAAVNALMTAFCRDRLPAPPQGDWFAGRPVMVLRNDYALRLFNGDVGIALPDADGALMVFFPSDTGGFRAISPLRLPEHETAFAMTVHKSQGSEFESLLILMPAQPHPVVTRELLYTAVTRARRKVALACSEAVLEDGILTSMRKHSGLMARMREASNGV